MCVFNVVSSLGQSYHSIQLLLAVLP